MCHASPFCRYAGRGDAGCLYNLKVKLLSENEDVVAEFESDTISVPPDNGGEWAEVGGMRGKRRRPGSP